MNIVATTRPRRRQTGSRQRPQAVRWGSVAIAIAAAVGLAACSSGGGSGGSGSSGKHTVTFWEFQTDKPSINAFKASITSFEKSHPGIAVQMQIVPWAEQSQKLTTAIASGGLPDVSMLGNDVVAQYVSEKQLLPVNLTNTANVTAGDKLYYHLNGKWYAVPLVDETRAVIYNKTLFSKAGITSPPGTFAQMETDAKQVKAKTGKIGWILPMAKNDYNTIQEFMSVYLGYGARYLQSNGSCGFNTPQFKQALTFYTSIYKQHLDSPDATVDQQSQMESTFTAGNAGEIIDSPSYYYELKTTNPSLYKQLGVAPIAAGPDGRYGFLGGWPLVVWKSAASSGVQQAATEFAEYVGSSGGGDTALATATGLIPANVSAAKQAPWNSGSLAVYAKQVASDAFPYQYPKPEIPQMGSLETDTVQTAVQSVALGTSSVNSATSTLCQAINSAVGK
jgi:ABC-type glycerol-3-phosphate transport system substrate-binding protein